MKRALLVVVALSAAQAGAFAKGLDIYFIDAEGGQSTLIVTPAGESLLIDAGFEGFHQPDAKHIVAAAHEAGLARIDYLLITHFHSDHDGGVPELARLIPIRTFIDDGTPIENGAHVWNPFDAYARVRRKGPHLQPKPGDRPTERLSEMRPLKESHDKHAKNVRRHLSFWILVVAHHCGAGFSIRALIEQGETHAKIHFSHRVALDRTDS